LTDSINATGDLSLH